MEPGLSSRRRFPAGRAIVWPASRGGIVPRDPPSSPSRLHILPSWLSKRSMRDPPSSPALSHILLPPLRCDCMSFCPHSGALAYHPVLKRRRASCARSDMFACRAEGAGGCVASNTQARMSFLQTGSGWDPVALRQIRRAERSYSRTMRNCARRRRALRSPGYGRRVIELHCSGRVAESGMIHLLCVSGWDPVALLRYAGKDESPPNGLRLGTRGIASNTQVGMLRRRLVRAAHG